MGMAVSGINFQLCEQLATERIFGQHSLNSLLNNPFWQTVLQFSKRFSFHPARTTGVTAIKLLSPFFASDNNFLGVDNDNKVTCIHVGSVGGFIFTPKNHSNLT